MKPRITYGEEVNGRFTLDVGTHIEVFNSRDYILCRPLYEEFGKRA